MQPPTSVIGTLFFLLLSLIASHHDADALLGGCHDFERGVESNDIILRVGYSRC